MKLSDTTISILKNLAAIRSSIILTPGNVLKTIHEDYYIAAEIEIAETIPTTVGIYDLSQFLGNITTLANPELTFTENAITIDDGEISMIYRPCEIELISPQYPKKGFALKKVDAMFDLKYSTLQKMLKLASMNNLEHLSILGKDKGIYLMVHNRKDDTSTFIDLKIADYAGADFMVTVLKDNLRILPDDYDVELDIDMMLKLTSKKRNAVYYISYEDIN